MSYYEVSYSTLIEAESPEGAARYLADLLNKPGVPQRGFYDVKDVDTGEEHEVDFGEDEF